jgi:hypothetical protein
MLVKQLKSNEPLSIDALQACTQYFSESIDWMDAEHRASHDDVYVSAVDYHALKDVQKTLLDMNHGDHKIFLVRSRNCTDGHYVSVHRDTDKHFTFYDSMQEDSKNSQYYRYFRTPLELLNKTAKPPLTGVDAYTLDNFEQFPEDVQKDSWS